MRHDLFVNYYAYFVFSSSLISDIRDKKITLKLTIGTCREKLIDHYKERTCKVQLKPWDKGSVADVKKIYTVVTMYKKDAHGKNLGEKDKVILQGSVDEIFTTKVNNHLPKRIVVIAGAGKGKTTAVAKMAYDWAHNIQGSAFEHLPLLFILRLRDVNRETSLGQAIIGQLLSDLPDLKPKHLEAFIQLNQQLCWILLDGLDECSGLMDSSNEFSGNIREVLQNRAYPSCRVLVTTRPHLEHEFEKYENALIYAKMEIEGFSADNSKKYIDKFFFNDSSTGNELHVYLSQNDVINELVSTPLFCLMVCYLWREKLLVGIDTQTKLFDSVNQFLWQHSRARSPDYTEEWLSRTIRGLGKVALKGLLEDSNKLVFSPEDFKIVPNVMQNGCELGIISITSSTDVYEEISQRHIEIQSIEFYHKLAQEHAAGKYLAINSSKVKVKWKLSKLDGVMKTKQKCIDSYEHLFRFASGTDDDVCMRIMTNILANHHLETSERYRIILDCSSESPGNEENVSSMVRGCVSQGTITLKSPTVYTVVGMNKLPEVLKAEVDLIQSSCS